MNGSGQGRIHGRVPAKNLLVNESVLHFDLKVSFFFFFFFFFSFFFFYMGILDVILRGQVGEDVETSTLATRLCDRALQ